jgi:hypothetical protein
MEDVREVSAEPSDPTRPKVNFDETSQPRIKESRPPLPAQPGHPQRFDDEDERHGTRHLWLFVEPPTGRWHVPVTAQRTQRDFTWARQGLGNQGSPEALVMRGVLDHLNTPKPASLYEALPPAEARRIARKREFHDTPKHGRWLHRAAIELRVLQQQCLDRRIPEEETLQHEIAAWAKQRNAEQATIDWRCSVTDAREKLKRFYPSLSS